MPQLARAEAEALLERFHRYLRDHNLPVTRPRDLVAKTVLRSGQHLSVDDIQRQLRDQGEPIGTATVYRALDILVETGLVKAHDFGEGFRRFEPVSGNARHEHLVCTRCGRVLEFANEQLERMLPIIADEHHFHLQHHRVELFGICDACQRREFQVPGPEAQHG